MALNKKKSGLGKGLDALMIDNSLQGGEEKTVSVKIIDIEPNRDQPRKVFNEEALTELTASIEQHGIIQPLIVRPLTDGGYQLVAGERRWRAARAAGLTEVPVVIKELSDEQTLEIALVENLQREDLNPLEEARGYKYMMDRLSITQDEAAKKVGKSRPAVANALRLLNLPPEIIEMLENSDITAGHARALLAFADKETMLLMAARVKNDGLSVREIEKAAAKKPVTAPKTTKKRKKIYDEIELAVNEATGRKVKIRERAKVLEIEFFDEDDLSALVNSLCD